MHRGRGRRVHAGDREFGRHRGQPGRDVDALRAEAREGQAVVPAEFVARQAIDADRGLLRQALGPAEGRQGDAGAGDAARKSAEPRRARALRRSRVPNPMLPRARARGPRAFIEIGPLCAGKLFVPRGRVRRAFVCGRGRGRRARRRRRRRSIENGRGPRGRGRVFIETDPRGRLHLHGLRADLRLELRGSCKSAAGAREVGRISGALRGARKYHKRQ